MMEKIYTFVENFLGMASRVAELEKSIAILEKLKEYIEEEVLKKLENKIKDLEDKIAKGEASEKDKTLLELYRTDKKLVEVAIAKVKAFTDLLRKASQVVNTTIDINKYLKESKLHIDGTELNLAVYLIFQK
jgi:hypothetical protein